MKPTKPTVPWVSFFVRIVLPTLVTIILFLAVIFLYILPTIEQVSLDRKREMVRELTNSAWNILAKFEYDEQNGILTRKEAQKLAIDQIRNLHYGQRMKDYFWINDSSPKMIIHPYRTDLNGKDLSQYMDPNGKLVFVEMVNVVKRSGSGFVEYEWQWLDDESRIVPKISFVKGFTPWDWIIGTGIYIEDVRYEISQITNRVIIIAVVILLLMILMLVTVVIQTYKADNERSLIEDELRISRERYRNLIESASVGIFVASQGHIIYANYNLLRMLGYTETEIGKQNLETLFDLGTSTEASETLTRLMRGDQLNTRLETRLRSKKSEWIDILLSTSEYHVGTDQGFIASVTDLTPQGDKQTWQNERISYITREKAHQKLLIENQTALSFLNSPLSELSLKPVVTCDPTISMKSALPLFTEHQTDVVFVLSPTHHPIGVLSDQSIRHRLSDADFSLDKPVSDVMSKDVHTLPSSVRVVDAGARMRLKDTTRILVMDNKNDILGVLRSEELTTIQKYSPVVLLEEIQNSNTPEEISEKNRIFPIIISIFVKSGAKPEYITRLITENTDMVMLRFIEFAIQQLGPPPAKFSLMIFGSVGRQEQTLNSDQDNAIVFEDVPEERREEAQRYFLVLGEKICGWLDKAGYSYCAGGYMAQNPEWCQPLSVWKTYYSNWIMHSNAADLLHTKIFFDFRSAFGDQGLIENLRAHLNGITDKTPRFFQMLSRNMLEISPPLGFFGNFVVESVGEKEKAFDIKSAMMPIIDYARIYALKHAINNPNTLGRLKRLRELGILEEQNYQEMVQAYSYLMQIRLNHQSENVASRVDKIDNYISPKKLTYIEQKILKEIFTQTKYFQTKLSYDFTGRPDGGAP